MWVPLNVRLKVANAIKGAMPREDRVFSELQAEAAIDALAPWIRSVLGSVEKKTRESTRGATAHQISDAEAEIAKARVSGSGRKDVGESCTGSDLGDGLKRDVSDPSRAGVAQALQEGLSRLLRVDQKGGREGGTDDLKGQGSRPSEIRIFRVEDPETVPNEIKQIVAVFEEIVRDFPDLRADFLKGLSKGLKATRGDELEG